MQYKNLICHLLYITRYYNLYFEAQLKDKKIFFNISRINNMQTMFYLFNNIRRLKKFPRSPKIDKTTPKIPCIIHLKKNKTELSFQEKFKSSLLWLIYLFEPVVGDDVPVFITEFHPTASSIIPWVQNSLIHVTFYFSVI